MDHLLLMRNVADMFSADSHSLLLFVKLLYPAVMCRENGVDDSRVQQAAELT